MYFGQQSVLRYVIPIIFSFLELEGDMCRQFFGQLPCLVFPELLGVCGLASDINLGKFSVITSSDLSPVSSGPPLSVLHLLWSPHSPWMFSFFQDVLLCPVAAASSLLMSPRRHSSFLLECFYLQHFFSVCS